MIRVGLLFNNTLHVKKEDIIDEKIIEKIKKIGSRRIVKEFGSEKEKWDRTFEFLSKCT